MNAYMDYILIQFGPYINNMGWVPMDLPDIVESFEAVSFDLLKQHFEHSVTSRFTETNSHHISWCPEIDWRCS